MVTPHEQYLKLAKILSINDLYFKREDLHPFGSHKGRSIPVMIDRYHSRGIRHFAITGSGNASYAAILSASRLNERAENEADMISLEIFVGQNIAPNKLDKLKTALAKNARGPVEPLIRMLMKERPLQALTEAVQNGATSLRQSSDDTSLVGYESLAEEITTIPKVGAVFIGTSSGSAAQALASYFLKHPRPVKDGGPIQVHIVQTSASHALVDAFNACDVEEEVSLADAIVDKTALRKNVLTDLIKQTGGTGWCATNDDIRTALGLVKTYTDLTISPNSALSVVGAMKAGHIGYEIKGAAVCVITGD